MRVLICTLLFLFCILSTVTQANAQDWQQLSGEHFIVYFIRDEKFAKDVLEKAEIYYRDIAMDLGYPRYSEFWLWEKRCKIYIYPDRDTFLKATNQPDWSQGMAEYKAKQIASYAWSKGFLDSLLPHEMAHLIFRDFVGFKGEIPLWLDEGVAQWEEKARRKQIKIMAKQLFQKEALLSIEDMMKLDIQNIKYKDYVYLRPTRLKDGKEGVLLISGDNLVNTYYVQAVSLVGFLIEKYGSDSFAFFCRQLRDGKSLEEAFKFAYPTYIRGLKELEERWRDYLEVMPIGG